MHYLLNPNSLLASSGGSPGSASHGHAFAQLGLAWGLLEQKYWMSKPQAKHWQLLLCFQPLLSTLHGTIARPVTKNRQGLGLAHSLLPPTIQSLAQGQCSWLPLLPIPQLDLLWAKPFLGP